MNKFTIVLFIFFSAIYLRNDLFGQQIKVANGLVAHFSFDNNLSDSSEYAMPLKAFPKVLKVSDRFFNSKKAIELKEGGYLLNSKKNRGIQDQLTISVWIKTKQKKTAAFVLSKSQLDIKIGYNLVLHHGQIALEGWDANRTINKGNRTSGLSKSNIADGNWHHIIAIVDRNLWQVWVDGQLEAENEYEVSNIDLANTANLVIGGASFSKKKEYQYSGQIDDLKIYNTVTEERTNQAITDTLNTQEILKIAKELDDEISEIYRTIGERGGDRTDLRSKLHRISNLYHKAESWKNFIRCTAALAREYNKADDFNKSKASALAGLKVAKQYYGEKDYVLAAPLSALGEILRRWGQYDEAIPVLNQYLKVYINRYGSKNRVVGETYQDLGWVYGKKGDINLKITYYEKALQTYLAIGNVKWSTYAYRFLASTYAGLRNFQKSANYFEKCWESSSNIVPEQDLLSAINNYLALGDTINCARLIEKIEAIADPDNYGFKKHYASPFLVAKGQFALKKKNYQAAIDNFEKGLSITGAVKKKAAIHHLLGNVYAKMGDNANAIKNYRTCLATHKKQNYWSFDKPKTYNSLASLDSLKLDERIELVKKAFEANTDEKMGWMSIYENPELENIKSGGKIVALESFALKVNLLFQKWEATQKVVFLERIIECCYLSHQLYYDIKKDIRGDNVDEAWINNNILENLKKGEIAASLLYQKKQKRKDYKDAYFFMESSKAIRLREVANIAKENTINVLPDSLAATEQALKNNIFYIDTKKSGIGLEKSEKIDTLLLEKQLFKAQFKLDSFINTIKINYPGYFDLKYNNDILDITTIQKSLDSKSIVLNYSFLKSQKELLIYLISKKKTVQKSIRWGNLEEQKVKKLYSLIQKVAIVRPKNKKQFLALAKRLYKQLIFPIEKELANKEDIIIIGDQLLNYLPFDLLIKDEVFNNLAETQSLNQQIPEEFLSEKTKDFGQFNYLFRHFNIYYNYSNTFLYNQKKIAKPTTASFLGFAPVFSTEQKVAPTLTRYYTDTLYQFADRGGSFQPIPYSETEVKRIGELFTKNTTTKTKLLIYKDANEASLKDVLEEEHQVIHLATHSFANFAQPTFSGIACYTNDQEATVEDGVLHIGEIYNLKIKADLVSLSSCESGLGKIEQGEGMLGINRAFIYAGAKNVLYSLWKVNDKITAGLMISFYDFVLKGDDYATALRKAKLQLLETEGTALPLYWSAFQLVGN